MNGGVGGRVMEVGAGLFGGRKSFRRPEWKTAKMGVRIGGDRVVIWVFKVYIEPEESGLMPRSQRTCSFL